MEALIPRIGNEGWQFPQNWNTSRQIAPRAGIRYPPAMSTNPSVTAPSRLAFFSLFRQRLCWIPTWRGWLALLLMCVAAAIVMVRGGYDFLAVNDPCPGGVLVIEGWAPDYALQETMLEFRRHPYAKLYVTGGPIEKGAPLCEYKTTAEFTVATLLRMGMTSNTVQAVPMPETRQDRTYTSALILKHWLRTQGGVPGQINLMTGGAHARRSRLMYEMAFGPEVQIGIVAIPNREFDPQRWWTSSAGVRTVLSELIAYGYARFVFHPPRE